MIHKSSKIETALLPSYGEAAFVDHRVQIGVSYLNWVWPALNGWSVVAGTGWDPTPYSKSTQLGLLYKKACMELSSYKKTRVEVSSGQSCFNIPHSQCLPLWLYNQTPLPFPAQSYQKTACLPSFVCHIHRTIQYTVFWSGFLTQGMMLRFAKTVAYLQLPSYWWIFFNAMGPIHHILLLPSSDGYFDGSYSGY